MEYPKAIYLAGDGLADCKIVESLEEELTCEGYWGVGQEPKTAVIRRGRPPANKE